MSDQERIARIASAVGASAFVLVDLAAGEPVVLGLTHGTLFTIITDDEDDASFLTDYLTRTGAPRFGTMASALKYATTQERASGSA